MKTKEQVLKYLSRHRFSNDDWKMVLEWCKKTYGGGNAHRSMRPVAESSYKEFLEWFDKGIGISDVVQNGKITGIVSNIEHDKVTLSAYINDKLHIKNKEVSLNDTKLADDATYKTFQQILRDNGYAFSFASCSCINVWLPDDGDFVIATYDRKVRLGIFAGFTENGCAFYVTIERNKCKFRQEVESQNIEFTKATKTDRDKITRILASDGLTWNAEKKTFDKILSKRAAKNGKYWYMSETFTIKVDYDLGRKLDDVRFESGNYFLNRDEAFQFAQKVQELRKQ